MDTTNPNPGREIPGPWGLCGHPGSCGELSLEPKWAGFLKHALSRARASTFTFTSMGH